MFLSDILRSDQFYIYSLCVKEEMFSIDYHIISHKYFPMEFDEEYEKIFIKILCRIFKRETKNLQSTLLRFYLSFLVQYYNFIEKKIALFELFKFGSFEKEKIKEIFKENEFCEFHNKFLDENVDKKKITTKSISKDLKLSKETKDDFAEIVFHPKTVILMHLDGLELRKFPIGICSFHYLTYLHCSSIPITSFPDEFKNLKNLTQIHISDTCINEFPYIFFQLPRLNDLKIDSTYPPLGYLPDDFSSNEEKKTSL